MSHGVGADKEAGSLFLYKELNMSYTVNKLCNSYSIWCHVLFTKSCYYSIYSVLARLGWIPNQERTLILEFQRVFEYLI